MGTVQPCLQAACVSWGFEEGESHFWLSHAYIAAACPTVMFLLTRRFAEKEKQNKTYTRTIKASGWNICVHTNKVGMLAGFDVC